MRISADGFDMDYTDVYAFTDALSNMIGTNLGDTQTLIGQVRKHGYRRLTDG